MRTPLALILGPVEDMLASQAPLDAVQRRQLSVVHRNALTLMHHVNDLLDLAKLDAHKLQADLQLTDLAALVANVAEQFAVVAQPRQVSFSVQVPESLLCLIDADKFERVLLNLLSNAFKFTPKGGRIRCVLELLADEQIVLSVQDSGPGVPASHRQAIFERFRQVQHGTTRSHGGTGLGLAIAKEFVALHQGSISVTEAPGGGALFQVAMPRALPGVAPELGLSAEWVVEPAGEGQALGDAAVRRAVLASLMAENDAVPVADDAALRSDDAAQGKRSGEVTTRIPAAAFERPVVLLVEDNAEMRRLIRQGLERDFAVAEAADGLAALELARTLRFDLVVTDLMLPGLGGDRFVQAMRKLPGLADVPVLVLSAKHDVELRATLLTGMVQDYVTKPFSIHELRARVRNLASTKLARDALQKELASQNKDLNQLTHQLIANRRALQESEYRWWAIFEHSPVGIGLIGSDGAILASNPAFRALVDYDADALQRFVLPRIVPVEDRHALAQKLARISAGELEDYHVQRRFQRKDGSIVWANTSLATIPSDVTELADVSETSETHPPARMIIVVEDITEQKRAEQALTQARHELARVARISTMGELVASIAHEVNQPLAAIVTNAQASLRWLDAFPPNELESRTAVQRIIRDANRAADVIARIRGFFHRGDGVRHPISLDALIQDVLDIVHAEVAARAVQVRCVHAGGPVKVLVDRVQIQQVLLNLIMNALEAMQRVPERERSLWIGTQLLKHDLVEVVLTDSGPGIEPAVLQKLFEPFQTTKAEGMGMGLAISRSIIEAHGGRIRVLPQATQAARGASLAFSLPLDETGALRGAHDV